MRGNVRLGLLISMLACGSGAPESHTGPARGETQACGASGVQTFDGSMWSACEEPAAAPPQPVPMPISEPMNPSPPLVCQPGAVRVCDGGEQLCLSDGTGYAPCIPDAPPPPPEPSSDADRACTCFAASLTTQDVTCTSPAVSCSPRGGSAAQAGCANTKSSLLAFGSSEARRLEASYPLNSFVTTFPFPSTAAECSGELSEELVDSVPVDAGDTGGCNCIFSSDIDRTRTLHTNVVCP
jgi:hypothetical protein